MRSASSLTADMLSSGRLPENPYEMVVNSKNDDIIGTEETVYFNNSQKWSITTRYCYKLTIVGVIDSNIEQAYFSDEICEILELTQVDLYIKVPYRSAYGARENILTFKKIVVDPNIGEYDISFGSEQLESLKKSIIASTRNFYIGDLQQWENYNFNMNSAQTVCSEAVGVSKEVFDKIYALYKEDYQFAIFIEDFAYIDEVQDHLVDKGFTSISCLKASTIGYDIPKVVIRYVNLFVSAIGLVVINGMVVLLGFVILRVKKNDYVIFKMLGLANKDIKKINYFELLVYSVIASILTLVTVLIVMEYSTIEVINDIFKFFKLYDILIVFIISIITSLLLGGYFGKFLSKKVRITVLKEE